MPTPLEATAGLAVCIWIYLLFFRGGFWRNDQLLPQIRNEDGPSQWPAVAIIVPARNEAAVIRRTLPSLLAQNYPRPFDVILVDDNSTDGTRREADTLSDRSSGFGRLRIVSGAPLPHGWSGKLWAVHQGLEAAAQATPAARYFLLTDADIAHPPDSLRRLVAGAEADNRELVSQMVMLEHRGFWGRLLIPAFVFFFQKLYPFRWVNDPKNRYAAAAGGCLLVRRTTLRKAGGIQGMRDAMIDDCTLGHKIKEHGSGRIWLGLGPDLHSLRPYAGLLGIWDMVTRTAFTQLRHSPLLLIGTLIGMILTYLAAPALVLAWPLHGNATAGAIALGVWLAMSLAYRPTHRLYGTAWPWVLSLPLAGLLYSVMTIHSAVRHWQGVGAAWKGRTYSGSKTATNAQKRSSQSRKGISTDPEQSPENG